MTFQERIKRIGALAVFLGMLGLFGVAGGVENLPPEAGFQEWAALFGAAVTSIMLAVFGLSLINEE